MWTSTYWVLQEVEAPNRFVHINRDGTQSYTEYVQLATRFYSYEYAYEVQRGTDVIPKRLRIEYHVS